MDTRRWDSDASRFYCITKSLWFWICLDFTRKKNNAHIISLAVIASRTGWANLRSRKREWVFALSDAAKAQQCTHTHTHTLNTQHSHTHTTQIHFQHTRNDETVRQSMGLGVKHNALVRDNENMARVRAPRRHAHFISPREIGKAHTPI